MHRITDAPALLDQSLRQRPVLLLMPDRTFGSAMTVQLRNLGLAQVINATFESPPMEWAQDFEPELVLFAHAGDGFDSLRFAKDLRRSDLPCRKAPLIMIACIATRDTLAAARDAGVDEVMLKPVGDKDIVERIHHVMEKKRPWIEAMAYIGPDRRKFNSGNFKGPAKRGTKRALGHLANVEQSVRILKSAILSFDSDRHQALRSMMAQMETLVANARVLADPQFTVCVGQLLKALKSPDTTRASLLPILNALVRYLNI